MKGERRGRRIVRNFGEEDEERMLCKRAEVM